MNGFSINWYVRVAKSTVTTLNKGMYSTKESNVEDEKLIVLNSVNEVYRTIPCVKYKL